MVSRSSPLLVNFGPWVSPQGQKVKNVDNALDSGDWRASCDKLVGDDAVSG